MPKAAQLIVTTKEEHIQNYSDGILFDLLVVQLSPTLSLKKLSRDC